MIRVLASAAVFFPILSLTYPVYAQQEITVRFLNYKTGKPIKNISVEVILWSGKIPEDIFSLRQNCVSDAKLKTDKTGQVLVDVPKFIPEHLYIGPEGIDSAAPSWRSPIFLAVVLKSGLVFPYLEARGHSGVKVSAKPGEIIFLTKKEPWLGPLFV